MLAVAEEHGFTRAAKRLGVSQSALSHAIRGPEERVGVRLLTRTTRGVAPTEAGEQLILHLRPALVDIRETLERISGLRERPAGRVRLLVPQFALMSVLAPKLGQFAGKVFDLMLPLDKVAEGYRAMDERRTIKALLRPRTRGRVLAHVASPWQRY